MLSHAQNAPPSEIRQAVLPTGMPNKSAQGRNSTPPAGRRPAVLLIQSSCLEIRWEVGRGQCSGRVHGQCTLPGPVRQSWSKSSTPRPYGTLRNVPLIVGIQYFFSNYHPAAAQPPPGSGLAGPPARMRASRPGTSQRIGLLWGACASQSSGWTDTTRKVRKSPSCLVIETYCPLRNWCLSNLKPASLSSVPAGS